MLTRKTIILIALALVGALTWFGCGASKQFRLDATVERRIDEHLTKRQALAQQNPAFSQLMTQLALSRQALNSRQYDKAFETLSDILKNQKQEEFPEYSYAKYYMAATLQGLGVLYGALLYYVDIVEKEPLRVHTHESLRRAIGLAQQLKDDELILYLASVIDADKVPKSLSEEFRYFIAKDLFQKKQYARSVKLLETISTRNRLYLAAQYLMGTIAVEAKRYNNAITFFKKISEHRSPIQYHEAVTIRQLAHLALGRIYYEQKNYPLAIEFYKKVERDGEYFPQSLYESSWALFKLHSFVESLSVLHSVNSPFFEQVYFLKSYLLKGAIFLELCQYDDALKALTEVEQEFKSVAEQIDRFAKQAQSPKEYYPLLSSRVTQKDGTTSYAYRKIFALATANRDFLGVHHYVERLRKERQILQSIKSPRSNLIASLVLQKENLLMERGSWLAGKKLLLTRQLVQGFFALQDFLRYEIVSTERKILQTRSLRLAPPISRDAALIRRAFTESLRESMIWWDYTGEYWEDELGAYLYNVPSLCKDSTEKK